MADVVTKVSVSGTQRWSFDKADYFCPVCGLPVRPSFPVCFGPHEGFRLEDWPETWERAWPLSLFAADPAAEDDYEERLEELRLRQALRWRLIRGGKA